MQRKLISVLVIEDNEEYAAMLHAALERQFAVTTAGTLELGLTHLFSEETDVVVLDPGLPDAEGLDAIRRVRVGAPSSAIVVLTGSDDEAMALQTIREGIQDYLVKGLDDVYMIVRSIRYSLERKRLADALQLAHDVLEIKVEERTAQLARTNEQLREAEALFRTVLNNAPIFLAAVDQGGVFTLAEGKKLQAAGFEPGELLGQSAYEVLTPVTIWEYNGRVTTGDELVRRALDGERVGGIAEIRGAFFDLRCEPMFDLNQLVVGAIAAATDVTERKQLELQLRQAQKMEAVALLASGVAHDFNNLLTTIGGRADLMLYKIEPDAPLRAHAEEIKKSAERGGALTRQLMLFGQRQTLRLQDADVGTLVAEGESRLRGLIGGMVQLEIHAGREPGCVRVDPAQFQQLLMNLAVNARDAMPLGGHLIIEWANVDLDEFYVRNHAGVAPGNYVMVAVSDTGTGMTRDVQERIFEPFFSTRDRGKGSGLGLSTVYGIVKQSGGHIWVYSEPGHGTTVKIYLPRLAETQAPAAEPAAAPTGSVQHSETILVVDDEESVRSLVRDILRVNGYRVLEASQGAEALMLADLENAPIHMLLTDVVMPRLTGPELAAKLGPLRPEMKMLFMSGYTDNAIVHHAVLNPGVAFIQKPFTADALLRQVRQVLDAPRI